MDFAWAAGLGALVGLSELLIRYRDAPGRVLRAPGAWAYVAVNASAAAAALIAIHAFGWTFGASKESAVAATQVLVAAFGSVALFRSGLFVFPSSAGNISAGPMLVLHALLTTADRSVDRARGTDRSGDVARLMATVDYDKAREALPVYCFALLQNVSADEQQLLASQVRELDAAQMPPNTKSLVLGLRLLSLVGERVLAVAVRDLGSTITVTTERP